MREKITCMHNTIRHQPRPRPQPTTEMKRGHDKGFEEPTLGDRYDQGSTFIVRLPPMLYSWGLCPPSQMIKTR